MSLKRSYKHKSAFHKDVTKWIYIRKASQNQKLIGLKGKLQFLLSVTLWTLKTGYLIEVGHLREVQFKFGRNGCQCIFIASTYIYI